MNIHQTIVSSTWSREIPWVYLGRILSSVCNVLESLLEPWCHDVVARCRKKSLEITHSVHGAGIYGVPWIPSIYPSHVSIYTSTMDPSWVMTLSFVYGWGSRNITAQTRRAVAWNTTNRVLSDELAMFMKNLLGLWITATRIIALKSKVMICLKPRWSYYICSPSGRRYNPMAISISLSPRSHTWREICTSASVSWTQTIGAELPNSWGRRIRWPAFLINLL